MQLRVLRGRGFFPQCDGSPGHVFPAFAKHKGIHCRNGSTRGTILGKQALRSLYVGTSGQYLIDKNRTEVHATWDEWRSSVYRGRDRAAKLAGWSAQTGKGCPDRNYGIRTNQPERPQQRARIAPPAGEHYLRRTPVQVPVPRTGRLFLPQETSASQARIEAGAGQRHLGLLQQLEKWCLGFDGCPLPDRGSS